MQIYENDTQGFSSLSKKQSSSFANFLHTFQQKDICQDISRQITAAYSKEKSGENNKKRGYQCSFCDKTFTRRENLLSHTGKVHTGENFFVCHVCNKSFSQKGNLKTHMRIHVGY